jgi:hypothetical protein
MPANGRILRTYIESTELAIEEDWAQNDEMLLWVLAVGVLVSFEDETDEWFSAHFLSQTNTLEIHTYFQLSRLFDTYLWLDRIEQASGWKLTQILEGRTQDNAVFTQAYLNDKRAGTVHRQFRDNDLLVLEIFNNQYR